MESERPAKKSFSQRSKDNQSNLGGAIVIIVFLVIIIGLVLKVTGGAKAKYQVSDNHITVVDNATVSVGFKVKNIGKASGQPNCTVNAHNPDSSNYGGNSGQLTSSIKPGDTYTTAMSVTITNQGANSVTTADIKCD